MEVALEKENSRGDKKKVVITRSKE